MQDNMPFIDVLSGSAAPDEADCFDIGMVTDGVDSWYSTMHNIEDTIREAGALAQLGNNHSSAWVPFGRFEHEGISCG